ncbi:MAG: PKD domain-containing protein [Patescibacteria group bacterium]
MNKFRQYITALICLLVFTETALAQAPQAIITIQKGNPQGQVPFSLNLDGSTSLDPEGGKLTYFWEYPDGKTYDSKNPRSHRFETAGTYEIKLTVTDNEGLSNTNSLQITANPKPAKEKKASKSKSGKTSNKSSKYQNGDLATQLNFKKIFPNPKGADKDQEFITIYNSSNQNINLGNWQLQFTTAKSTSTIKLSDQLIINSQSELILKNSDLKRSLPNSQTKITLLDFNDQQIDQISYKTALENLILAKIKILNWQTHQKINTTLLWIKPTDNFLELYETQGNITEINSRDFVIQTKDNQKINLQFTDEDISQNILKINSEINAIIAKTDSGYQLLSYEIKSINNQQKQNQTHDQNNNFLIISLAIIVILIVFGTIMFRSISPYK